jgi:hypothetical protein
MKLLIGRVVPAGLIFVAAAAHAQALTPYEAGRSSSIAVSDVGPYATIPPQAPAPGYGPRLLPAAEVYTIVRESGFSPLGTPQQRGLVYTISVIDRGGDDGKLVIDARSGRIIRFMPAYRMGDNFNDDLNVAYGPVGPLPPVANVGGVPRPPRSIPHVASRTPSLPKPLAAKPAAEPSAVVHAKPAEAPATPQGVTTGSAQAKPTVQLAPTQAIPAVQGLD